MKSIFQAINTTISSQIASRLGSPLLFSYVLAFVILNYKISLLIFSNVPYEEKVRVVDGLLSQGEFDLIATAYLYPLLFSVAYTFVYPVIEVLVAAYLALVDNFKSWIVILIERKKPLDEAIQDKYFKHYDEQLGIEKSALERVKIKFEDLNNSREERYQHVCAQYRTSQIELMFMDLDIENKEGPSSVESFLSKFGQFEQGYIEKYNLLGMLNQSIKVSIDCVLEISALSEYQNKSGERVIKRKELEIQLKRLPSSITQLSERNIKKAIDYLLLLNILTESEIDPNILICHEFPMRTKLTNVELRLS